MERSREVGSRGPALLLAAAGVASISNFGFHAVGSRLLGPDNYSSLAALLALLGRGRGAGRRGADRGHAGVGRVERTAARSATVERTAHAGLVLLVVGLGLAIPLDRMLELHDSWGIALTAAWAAVACMGAVAKGALLGGCATRRSRSRSSSPP